VAPINKGPGIILRFGSWPQPAARDQIKLHKRCEGFDQPNRSTRPDDSTVQSQETQPEDPAGQHDPATPKRRAMDRREGKPSFTKYEGQVNERKMRKYKIVITMRKYKEVYIYKIQENGYAYWSLFFPIWSVGLDAVSFKSIVPTISLLVN